MIVFDNKMLQDIEFPDTAVINKTIVSGDNMSSLALDGVVYIYKGAVEVRSSSLDGSKAVVKTLKDGDIFGIIELFCDSCNNTELVCIKNSTLAIIKKEYIMELMHTDSEFCFRYIKLLHEKINFLFERLSCFATRSAPHRVASLLLQENNSVSREEQASLLGISRATLFRELNAFKERGIIDTKGKNVYIKDREALEKICTCE